MKLRIQRFFILTMLTCQPVMHANIFIRSIKQGTRAILSNSALSVRVLYSTYGAFTLAVKIKNFLTNQSIHLAGPNDEQRARISNHLKSTSITTKTCEHILQNIQIVPRNYTMAKLGIICHNNTIYIPENCIYTADNHYLPLIILHEYRHLLDRTYA